MDEHTQLTEAAELVGKTIARVFGLGGSGPDAIVFDDGSFAVIDAEGDEDYMEVSILNKPADCWILKNLGLITEEEYRVRDKANRDARIAADEARARAEYEHLKARFEPQPTEAK